MFSGFILQEKKIEAGCRVLFNPLPTSIPVDVKLQIETAVAETPEVIDAYLTHCNLPSEPEPRLVLVVGVTSETPAGRVANRLMEMLDDVRWERQGIDVLPFNQGSVPVAVLHAGKKIS